MFQDTFKPVDTKIRAVRAYEKPTLDMRHSQRFRKEADPSDVMRQSMKLTTSTAFLVQTLETPKLMKDVRQETNQVIHDSVRETKRELLALRDVHQKVSLEYNALHKARAHLELEIQKARRAIWVAEQSLYKRTHKPRQSNDTASDLLREEISFCKGCKTRMETNLSDMTSLYHALNKNRISLEELIKVVQMPLKLNSEGYSNPTSSPVSSKTLNLSTYDTQTLPAAAKDALKCIAASKSLRAETKALVLELTADMKNINSQVLIALKESIALSKTVERDVAFQKAETKLSKNVADRKAFVSEIVGEINEGPLQGTKWMTVSQKKNRPLVLVHNQAHSSASGYNVLKTEVQGRNVGHDTLSRSYNLSATASKDQAHNISELSDLEHDLKHSKLVDQQVARFIVKHDPTRRVLTKSS